MPTLLVEGEDDAAIYRWLENQLGLFSGSVLFCSGRDVLISIYRKRDTFSHGKLAWLADLDMWRFSPPPADLDGIVFTTGYSIENDLYAGSRIEALLEEDERTRHSRLLGVLCRWFAFEVLEFLNGREAQVAHHVRRVVDLDAMEIHPGFASVRGFSEPDPSFIGSMLADYQLNLRGKTLIDALITYLRVCLGRGGFGRARLRPSRLRRGAGLGRSLALPLPGQTLSDSRRTPKYSKSAIIEMCLKLYPENPHVKRLVSEANRRLG